MRRTGRGDGGVLRDGALTNDQMGRPEFRGDPADLRADHTVRSGPES
jgi:hypothetical protein